MLYITLKVADAGFGELFQQAAHEELTSEVLRANEHAVLQKSHLVGSELHPLCNTATTRHLEGSQTGVGRGEAQAYIGLSYV